MQLLGLDEVNDAVLLRLVGNCVLLLHLTEVNNKVNLLGLDVAGRLLEVRVQQDLEAAGK